jgi:hypothetical protein
LNEAYATSGNWQEFGGEGLPDEVHRFACNNATFDRQVPDPFQEARDFWRERR